MTQKLFRTILRVLVVMTIAPVAFADPGQQSGLVTLDQIGTGNLLLKTDIPGKYVRAPLVSSHFDVLVTGPIVRATLSQRFRNPSDAWVEGRYAFPLPDEAAVDVLKMRIGERFIEGQIRERQQAREVYEQARTEGRKAALIEQHRPNLFTNDVANIGPDEVVVVQISWLQTLEPEQGAFELRLPLVVAPRYDPRPMVHPVDFGPNGWAMNDPVPDRDTITSPLVDPRKQEKGTIHNPVTIKINLDAGFPLDLVESRHHAINLKRPADTTAEILLDGAVAADRDFVMRWTAAIDGIPHAALFRETVGDKDYYLAMLTPPEPKNAGPSQPRQVIFVQDVSGSMDGESIGQAREGLRLALHRLKPADSFNIILFNDQYAMFADRPVPASEANIKRALEAVANLEAGGGTEMLPALKAALADQWTADGQLRQIIFLTDGAVGNEAQMLVEISKHLGRSRLFTVGIGSAPNSYFMTRSAELGRGTTVYVDDLTRVAEQMDGLFAKLENPVLTDVAATLPDGSGDISPDPLPDLYAGDPVVFAFHAPKGTAGEVVLSANRGDNGYGWRMDLNHAAARNGVAKLWARKNIRALETLSHSEIGWEMGQERLDAQILKVALTHQLVSRLTSLVAVDKTPSSPDDAPFGSAKVPLNLPDGWNADVFMDAETPAFAPAQPLLKKASLPPAQLARLKAAPAAAKGAATPRGSLNWKIQLFMGLLLMLLTLLTWLWTRRRVPGGTAT